MKLISLTDNKTAKKGAVVDFGQEISTQLLSSGEFAVFDKEHAPKSNKLYSKGMKFKSK